MWVPVLVALVIERHHYQPRVCEERQVRAERASACLVL